MGKQSILTLLLASIVLVNSQNLDCQQAGNEDLCNYVPCNGNRQCDSGYCDETAHCAPKPIVTPPDPTPTPTPTPTPDNPGVTSQPLLAWWIILIIVVGCVLAVILLTVILCKCRKRKRPITIAEKEAMFNSQAQPTGETEYAINPEPIKKPNESMASDSHPYIPPGYNEYVGGPGTAGHFRE